MKALSYLVNRIGSSPLLWGTASYAIFIYLLKNVDAPGVEFLRRYATGHPIEFFEVFLFFLGWASLIVKACRLAGEWAQLPYAQGLVSPTEDGLPEIFEKLRSHASTLWQHTYLRMFKEGLLSAAQSGSSQYLNEHLRELLQEELETRRGEYGFVRLVVWGIPILGFLGTVVGITLSLGNLAPQQLEETLPTVMAGLMVAFDTTALALALSMILMLVHYVVDRAEQTFVRTISGRVREALFSLLVVESPAFGSQKKQTVAEEILQARTRVVETQTELWQKMLEEWHGTTAKLWANAGRTLETALMQALEQAGERHAERLREMETTHLQTLAGWEEKVLAPLAARVAAAAEALHRATENLTQLEQRVSEQEAAWRSLNQGTAELAGLQKVLEQNLATVVSAKHFEEALATLAAAANLLSAHLHRLPADQSFRPETHSTMAKAA